MSDDHKNCLGGFLKDLINKRSLSLRKLSELTGIDASIISRIINGKRKAKPEHLQKFADCLEIPVSDLFLAAGYTIEKEKESPYSDDLHASVDCIEKVLESTKLYNNKTFTIQNIEQRLHDYTKFVQTDEGKETILSRFEVKLQSVGSIGPFIDHLKDMFLKFSKLQGTPYELALMGGALLYFILPVDVIPDYIFPIGYMDDAIVVQLVLELLTSPKKERDRFYE